MDEFDREDFGSAPYKGDGENEDAYEALNDRRRVMMEVVALVEDLHRATTRLGDAIAAAGLPARAWRDADCRLLLLTDQFPDITLDALITRLAEFAADMGPHWLHGGREDIAHFNDEVSILYGVVRPLRMVAQRLRMVPARERGDLPIERALGDGRVGTPLDRVAAVLRDLDSLGPYVAPLAPEEWKPLTPEPPRQSPPAGAGSAGPSAAGVGGGASATQQVAAGASLPVALPPAPPVASSSQAFRRLRDFLPPPEARQRPVGIQGRDWSWLRADVATQTRALVAWVKPRKWVVVGITIMLLALGTALLTLARQSASSATGTPTSSLAASPAQITLGCSGKSATLTLTLRDTGAQPLTWTIKAPSGLSLSATHGTLKPGASASITVKVTSAKAAHGTLAFTSNEGDASVGYVVKC